MMIYEITTPATKLGGLVMTKRKRHCEALTERRSNLPSPVIARSLPQADDEAISRTIAITICVA